MRNKLILLSLLLSSVTLVSACVPKLSFESAENGKTVQVEYTGKLKDGTIFDTSVGKEPLEFTLGGGQMIPGFEKAVLGMKVGDTKTVTVPSAEAYGPRDESLVTEVSKKDLPEGMTPRAGQRLQAMDNDGGITVVTITAVNETTVTIDANHQLAGQDLIFEIKLVGIK